MGAVESRGFTPKPGTYIASFIKREESDVILVDASTGMPPFAPLSREGVDCAFELLLPKIETVDTKRCDQGLQELIHFGVENSTNKQLLEAIDQLQLINLRPNVGSMSPFMWHFKMPIDDSSGAMHDDIIVIVLISQQSDKMSLLSPVIENRNAERRLSGSFEIVSRWQSPWKIWKSCMENLYPSRMVKGIKHLTVPQLSPWAKEAGLQGELTHFLDMVGYAGTVLVEPLAMVMDPKPPPVSVYLGVVCFFEIDDALYLATAKPQLWSIPMLLAQMEVVSNIAEWETMIGELSTCEGELYALMKAVQEEYADSHSPASSHWRLLPPVWIDEQHSIQMIPYTCRQTHFTTYGTALASLPDNCSLLRLDVFESLHYRQALPKTYPEYLAAMSETVAIENESDFIVEFSLRHSLWESLRWTKWCVLATALDFEDCLSVEREIWKARGLRSQLLRTCASADMSNVREVFWRPRAEWPKARPGAILSEEEVHVRTFGTLAVPCRPPFLCDLSSLAPNWLLRQRQCSLWKLTLDRRDLTDAEVAHVLGERAMQPAPETVSF
jgi:hypothetical protein